MQCLSWCFFHSKKCVPHVNTDPSSFTSLSFYFCFPPSLDLRKGLECTQTHTGVNTFASFSFLCTRVEVVAKASLCGCLFHFPPGRWGREVTGVRHHFTTKEWRNWQRGLIKGLIKENQALFISVHDKREIESHKQRYLFTVGYTDLAEVSGCAVFQSHPSPVYLTFFTPQSESVVAHCCTGQQSPCIELVRVSGAARKQEYFSPLVWKSSESDSEHGREQRTHPT